MANIARPGGWVRVATLDDAKAVAEIYAPNVAETVISFEAEPPDEREMATRMSGILAQFPWLVYELDGDVVGYAYAGAHRARHAYQWSVDTTVYVSTRAHRRGVARALYTPLLAILRRQGYQTAHAGITLPNAASVGFHESQGFTLVGVYPEVGFKFGAWRDVGWWRLSLGELPARPADPVPFRNEMLTDSV